MRSELSSASELKVQSSRASDITSARFHDPLIGSIREQPQPNEHFLHASEDQTSFMLEEATSFDLAMSEKIAPVMVRAVTLTDEDTGKSTSSWSIDWLIEWLLLRWSKDWSIDWLIDWLLIGQLIDLSIDWLIDDWLIDWLH